MASELEEIKPILVDRPPTADEYSLARWMLENGKESGKHFLAQLDQARVCALCPCGCASIDFSIGGQARPVGPLQILGDFLYYDNEDNCLANVFIFAVDGVLAGLEVFSFEDSYNSLPSISGLRLWDSK